MGAHGHFGPMRAPACATTVRRAAVRADAPAHRRARLAKCRTCSHGINRAAAFHWTGCGAFPTLACMDEVAGDRRPSRLSQREVEVLQLIAGGARNKHIARALGLSVHTVKRHVARTMVKLKVRSRGEAACAWRREMRPVAQPQALQELTARELDVLARVANGARNDEIASELNLSPNTVKRHTANIREKLGVHSRVHAAALLQGAPALRPAGA
jgi:DNA-binding NarL/FixJ family response regulator